MEKLFETNDFALQTVGRIHMNGFLISTVELLYATSEGKNFETSVILDTDVHGEMTVLNKESQAKRGYLVDKYTRDYWDAEDAFIGHGKILREMLRDNANGWHFSESI